MQISTLFEQVDRRYMREMADLYDPNVPPHLNPPYVAKVIELNEEWARQIKDKTFAAKDEERSAQNIEKLEDIQLNSPNNG